MNISPTELEKMSIIQSIKFLCADNRDCSLNLFSHC